MLWIGGYGPRFQAFFAALSFLRFDGESRPTYLPLTQAVGQFLANHRNEPMKTKMTIAILFVAIGLASCAPTEIAVPTSAFTSNNWQEYSSEFTSAIGTIHYSIRYPPDWYVYPGSTKSEPGLEAQTYIQDFERIGEVGGDTAGYQVAGTVRLEIYALPCAKTEEGCDPTGLSILAPNLSGVKNIEGRSGWTVWTVFLYKNDYRFSLEGYILGTPEDNDDLLKVLDEILSTVVVK